MSDRRAILDWIRDDVPLAGKMNLLPAHVDALLARLEAARSEARAEAEERMKRVVEAAVAVIARWDTPLWKDVGPTANVINELRRALEALQHEAVGEARS